MIVIKGKQGLVSLKFRPDVCFMNGALNVGISSMWPRVIPKRERAYLQSYVSRIALDLGRAHP